MSCAAPCSNALPFIAVAVPSACAAAFSILESVTAHPKLNAARAAVENLMRVLSIEWARYGIALNAIAAGQFGIDDVARAIVAKLIHRHPHVFGAVKVSGADDVLANWARLKATEKAQKGKHGALEGIPRSAPALLRATRAGEKAAAVGFDFPDAASARRKVDEELRELDQVVAQGDRAEMARELGDALFSLVNLGRKLNLDPESALRDATDKFARRFARIESALAATGHTVAEATPEEQDRLWSAAKIEQELAERIGDPAATAPPDPTTASVAPGK